MLSRLHNLNFPVTLFLACLIGGGSAAPAQPVLTLKRLVNNWPAIEMYFTASCNGQYIYAFDKDRDITVTENGIPVDSFTLDVPPDAGMQVEASSALLFDAGAFTSPEMLDNAKSAATALTGFMTMQGDELSVSRLANPAYTLQELTRDKDSIAAAISALAGSGTARLWDGLYASLLELGAGAHHSARSIVLFTAGRDDGSARSSADVIALAGEMKCRIFVVLLTDGQHANTLFDIAASTGGRMYHAVPVEILHQGLEELASLAHTKLSECRIAYQTRCLDGVVRLVRLGVTACGGEAGVTASFHPPKDTSTFMPIEFALGNAMGEGSSEAAIPLTVGGKFYSGLLLHPCSFTVRFDRDCVQWTSVTVPPGTMLEGVPLIVEPVTGGVRITLTEPVAFKDSAALAYFHFRLSDPDDSTCCEIGLDSWQFASGCLRAIPRNGEICIIPRAAIVSGNISSPRELVWVHSRREYVPNPFTVECRVLNTGRTPARNARFRLDYDPADFELISPLIGTQPGNPADVAVNGMSSAAWRVRAVTRLTGDSVMMRITASFDNHKDITMCWKIWIPPTEPILLCSISPVSIIANFESQRYEPMPFDLTVNVLNVGAMKTDTVFATIIVPPDLSLHGPDAPDLHTKKVSAEVLLPNQSGTVTWTLYHPITLSSKEYVVQVWVKSNNADSSLCETKVIIPLLGEPALRMSGDMPKELVFRPDSNDYDPNPFPVSLTAINVGKAAADSVSAFLYLGSNLELDPPGQPLRHYFGTLDSWKMGDPVPSHTWTVRWTQRFRYNTVADCKWALGGVSSVSGLATDTIYAFHETDVPGLKPSFASHLFGPKELVFDSDSGNYIPNPFSITYRLWNTSYAVAAINKMECYFPNDGIALDPTVAGNTWTRSMNHTVLPGDSVEMTWVFNTELRTDSLSVYIMVVAYDDEGNPLACDRTIRIPAVPAPCMDCAGGMHTAAVEFDTARQCYSEITLSRRFYNCGEWTLRDFKARLRIESNPFGLLGFDTHFPEQDVIASGALHPGDTVECVWHLKVVRPNLTGVPQHARYAHSMSAGKVPWTANACESYVDIAPAEFRGIRSGEGAGDTVQHYDPGRGTMLSKSGARAPGVAPGASIVRTYPNPFIDRTDIEYEIFRASHVRIEVFDLLGRRAAELVNCYREPGTYSTRFLPASGVSGFLIIRLETGTGVYSKAIFRQH